MTTGDAPRLAAVTRNVQGQVLVARRAAWFGWVPEYLDALAKSHDTTARVVADLDAEHRPDPELKGRGGCIICWPKDGSWPCTTRQIADELRAAL